MQFTIIIPLPHQYCPLQSLSNFSVLKNHVGILFQCRFWFSTLAKWGRERSWKMVGIVQRRDNCIGERPPSSAGWWSRFSKFLSLCGRSGVYSVLWFSLSLSLYFLLFFCLSNKDGGDVLTFKGRSGLLLWAQKIQRNSDSRFSVPQLRFPHHMCHGWEFNLLWNSATLIIRS